MPTPANQNNYEMEWMQFGGFTMSVRELVQTCSWIVVTPQLRGQGDRGKRTSDWAGTQDLCSITEFQSCKPPIPIEILLPNHPLVLLSCGVTTIHEQVCTSSWTLSNTHRDRGSYFHLRLADFVQHASRRWACYHHTAHSTSLEARVLSGRWIAAHLWPVLKGDWGWRISTRISGSRGWNSAIERWSRVQAQSPVLLALSPCPSELWSYNCPWTWNQSVWQWTIS